MFQIMSTPSYSSWTNCRVCPLMSNYTVSRGDMWTITMTIADQTASYVHGLSLRPRDEWPVSEGGDASVHTEESGAWLNRAYCMGVGRPGSVPFVYHRPGAYGRLLLAVDVRWKTGLLVSSDWLRPVARGGGGGRRAGPRCVVRLMSAD